MVAVVGVNPADQRWGFRAVLPLSSPFLKVVCDGPSQFSPGMLSNLADGTRGRAMRRAQVGVPEVQRL